jgi:hypothetical protein
MLPSFPQSPQTLITRQLECARCRETFTIAEDHPKRQRARSQAWQVPQEQYPMIPLRFDNNRGQVGVIPEIRTQPTRPIRVNQNFNQTFHLNCPRCGADNRTWSFISSELKPMSMPPTITGFFVSLILVISILFFRQPDLISDRVLATLSLILAAFLPLLMVPGQWYALRDYHLAQRFLPMLPQRPIPPTVQTVLLLYITLILVLPGIRYGITPIIDSILATFSGTENIQTEIAKEIDFWKEWLYVGSLTSITSSVFALLGVNAVLSKVNNQLPRPIYANTANMVRVTLWETRRALEINEFFDRIQWTLTKRNDSGGIDMEGYFRDPPEFLPNGQLDEEVRVQKYLISTDRWCVITKAEIIDGKKPRPAGGISFSMPPSVPATNPSSIPPSVPATNPSIAPVISVGRQRY